MGRSSREAGRRPAGADRRQGARPPGGEKKPAVKTTRIQLHLGEQTVKRLNVHAALVTRNASREADRILAQWLKRFGEGREVFPPDDQSRDPTPDADDDRQTEEDEERDSGEAGAA